MPTVRSSDLTMVMALAWGLFGAISFAQPSSVFQPVSPSKAVAPAATLQVQNYLQIEQALQQALQEHQATLLNAWIDPHLQVRTADGWLMDFSAWVANATGRMLPPEQLTVQQLDSVDIVSFIQMNPKTLKKRWIVDIWKASDKPILLLRHESEWLPLNRAIKSTPSGIPQTPKPDGKG